MITPINGGTLHGWAGRISSGWQSSFNCNRSIDGMSGTASHGIIFLSGRIQHFHKTHRSSSGNGRCLLSWGQNWTWNTDVRGEIRYQAHLISKILQSFAGKVWVYGFFITVGFWQYSFNATNPPDVKRAFEFPIRSGLYFWLRRKNA